MDKKLKDYDSALSILNSVIESTADGILVIANEGNIVISNKKFQSLWKIPDSVLESNDDKQLLTFITNQLLEPEKFIKKVQYLYNHPNEEDNDIIYFNDGRIFERFSAPYIMNDTIIGRVWSFRDVTKQKESEETLRRERILFRTIIDNLPDAIYAKDINFKKTLTNAADLKNNGCKTEAELLGKTDYDFFSKEEADKFLIDDKIIIETGNPVINREENFIDKQGNKNWLLTTKLPLIESDGKIIGLIGVGRNITIRKKNELIRQALYEISEAILVTTDMDMLYKRIHQVVSNLMHAENFFIAIYDDKKNMISFPYMVDEFDPPFASKPFGKGLTEYIIRTGEPALIDAKRDAELKEAGEVELIGTPAEIWMGVPLKVEGKILGVIVLQDYNNLKAYGNDELQLLVFISEQIAQAIVRKRNTEEIKKYTSELKELNQTKDKFFSIIAHDLKNPFITLLGFSEILLSDFHELQSDEVLFYLNEMKISADLSHNLLQNLLLWSRSQTGKIEFNPEQHELNKLIEQNILLVKNSADKKGIIIVNNIKSQININVDDDMLNTVIRNLLTNAIKFTRKDGSITIDAEVKNKFTEISISDTGVGMDEKSLGKLFRLDSTESKKGTDNETGTGLGLILCKEFVEKHGGTISVKSNLGIGTTFIFTLPI